ncbi:Uncharacterised protein [Zhongshania aliphaticivorans]|uniref:Uncharacterized protein n=1 Tax=Zhongshania aliphaticivorans TaxID=1470434 RepID=A0A5S9N7G8_9GAMM|nr:hypothetical protein [Zhongshania aliphaticivorans]CAA0079979.1 Uncharacterised protein [Zhongshania aliphaticivorans]CAA0085905.1 Uncharacterised protein [Zhongshania aliphaticivorans]
MYFDGSDMTPPPFMQRKLNVELYSQCYEEKSSDGVLGSLTIKESSFNVDGVNLPISEKIYLSYGILNHCMLNWSISPQQGAEYVATFDNVFGGCNGNLYRLEGGERIKEGSAMFLKLDGMKKVFGDPKSWRQCKNIPE